MPEPAAYSPLSFYTAEQVDRFVAEVAYQLPQFNYEDVDFAGSFQLPVKLDVTELTLPELGQYASQVVAYGVWLSDSLSRAEGRLMTVSATVKQYERQLAKAAVDRGEVKPTYAKDYVQDNPTLLQIKELELEYEILYNSLKRKYASVEKLAAHLSRDMSRRGMENV